MRSARRRRAALAGAALVAVVSAIGLGGAAPASGETCTPPTVYGFSVYGVTAVGIGCDEARRHINHVLAHGTEPHGWDCTYHHFPGTFRVEWSCRKEDFSEHTLHFGYEAHR
jgi:hypothetical protein